ncbi:MAG TPA: ABC transporter ATP-binding protein [Bacillota bacterium]|nr:ABC transporter ATP-binding protein [Bacillota bacterium]
MIELKEVSLNYKEVRALDNINLSIKPGKCHGLIGPNGAGKSSLVKVISGIIRDFKGKVSFIDKSIRGIIPGYVPQDISLQEKLSTDSNLNFYGRIYGLKGKELANRKENVLKAIGLENRLKSKVSTFSGGMKRRLNIGCAIMHQPDLIILDEPTVGVDPQSRKYIFELIRSLKQEGKTIIYTSHYMEEIELLCDEVTFIDKGKVIEHGTIDNLINKYSESSIYIEGVSKEFISEYDWKSKDNGIQILSDNPLSDLSEISKKFEEVGVEPTQLSLMKPSLEEVFFKLTGTDLRDTNI